MALKPTYEELDKKVKQLEKSKKSLLEKEYRFQNIYNNLLDVYYESDIDGTILEISPSVEKHSKYTRKELIGSSLYEIFSSRPEQNKLIELVIKNERVLNYEISMYDKDGTEYLCILNCELVRDKMARPIKFVGLFHNITERKQAEEELLASEAKFRLIFESAPLGIIHYSNAGVITACNNNFIDIIGSSREVLVGLDMAKLPDQRIVNTLKEALKGCVTQFEGEYSSTTANKVTPIRLLFSPIFSNQGNLDGGIGIIEDVSERKEAQNALRESEKKYKHLFNKAPSGMCEVDLKNGTFINANNVMCDYSGYSKEEFLSMKALDMLTESSQRVFLSGLKKLITGEEVSDNTEYNIIKKNGQKLCVVLSSHVIYKTGKLSRMMIVVHDVTERKKIEEMMIQSEKMVSVGGLAAGMAHEINNPLAGMMQTAAVMSMRLSNLDIPANQRIADSIGIRMSDIQSFMEKRGIPRMLNSINESGNRMSLIVDNMLSFSRKSDTLVSSHSLPKLLDKTLELATTDFDLKKHYDFKVIQIEKEYAADVPIVVCEGSKIQQVMLNVLRNGAQAMQEAKTEKPKFHLRVFFEETTNMVCFEIEDNGPGMKKKVLKRVFEPFFTTKPVGIGTGLGLSISYFIITENHDGEMSVESTPGTGSKFIIRLPLEGKRG